MSEAAVNPIEHRQRILHALAEVLLSKAYNDVTIADIASEAKISKRTFYEHFENKALCLWALCEKTSEQIMGVIMQAYRPEMTWSQMVHGITGAYLKAIEDAPVLMHSLYMQLPSTGEHGLVIRREIGERFAVFLCQQVDALRARGESIKALDHFTAIAVIAGINELVLQFMMDGKPEKVTELAEVAKGLVHAVTHLEKN